MERTIRVAELAVAIADTAREAARNGEDPEILAAATLYIVLRELGERTNLDTRPAPDLVA